LNGTDRTLEPTIRSALLKAATRLAAASDSAALDARVLMEHVTGFSHADIIANSDTTLTEAQHTLFEELVDLRQSGTPVAYITGHREFWSMDFLVTPEILIPRPETETIVEQALEHIPEKQSITVADLGTGSGVIALAIAYERPHAQVIATDTSILALEVARVNEENLGLGNVELRQGHWLEALKGTLCDVIVSNPPYIRIDDPHLDKGDVRYEPTSALVSGNDGLDAIREIISNAPAHMKPGAWLLLEHGCDQGQRVRDLMSAAGYVTVATIEDLSKTERVTVGQFA
jgi:release factor glutamine methyltransferase